MRPDRRLPLLILGCIATLLAPASSRGAEVEFDDVLETFVEEVSERPAAIEGVLRQYAAIELSEKFRREDRYLLHRRLIDALRRQKSEELADAARSFLGSNSRSLLPAQVVILKTLSAKRFPAPRRDRVEWLASRLRRGNARLTIWCLRTLGDLRWPQAVDAMVEVLDEEERRGRSGSVLWQLVSLELYKVLGKDGIGIASTVRARWENRRKKLPEAPDHSAGSGSSGGRTTFFGDPISPRAIFCIDTSSSMRQEAKLSRGKKAVKVEVVKTELERAVGSLDPTSEFNILRYNSGTQIWRGNPRRPRLYDADDTARESARRFARSLVTYPGTNIHDALVLALECDEVETIYLLSDGEPSRGGTKEEIEKLVELENYLLGVRIVTYGITPEEGGSFDEEFMKRLAGKNWGWYRRLNGRR